MTELPKEYSGLLAKVRGNRERIKALSGASNAVVDKAMTPPHRVGREGLRKLNRFFTHCGYTELDWDALYDRNERTRAQEGAARGTRATPATQRVELNGDAWVDIRRLHLACRIDEAFALAFQYLDSEDTQSRFAAARALIYLNHRCGRRGPLVQSVQYLLRLTRESPNGLNATERIVTASDIAKALFEHQQTSHAAVLITALDDVLADHPTILNDQLKSSILRGIGQVMSEQRRSREALAKYKYATELIDESLDARTGNSGCLIFCSDIREVSPRVFDRAWDAYQECIERALSRDWTNAFHRDGRDTMSTVSANTLAPMLLVRVVRELTKPQISNWLMFTQPAWSTLDFRISV